MLTGKKITLAVTGSVAAYKTVDLCRALDAKGAALRILMTKAAKNFIGPSTFSAITGDQPVTDMFQGGFTHITAGQDADLIVVAPATANCIAKLAAGIADDIVSATVLAGNCPVIICPAMNDRMWHARVTERNVKIISSLGYELVGPETGELACGQIGEGRLAGKEKILKAIINRVSNARKLADKKILVTAGPTREYMDPVRFLSNPSSGKMGYVIAEEADRRGGQVSLLSGPTSLTTSRSLELVPFQSALDLDREVKKRFEVTDALVMTAAVSDHRFARRLDKKIDKEEIPPSVELTLNPDILKNCARSKKDQIVVGFTAVSDDLRAKGLKKLSEKNADMMVAVKVDYGKGFGREAVDALIIDKDGVDDLGVVLKTELAVEVVDRLGVLLAD